MVRSLLGFLAASFLSAPAMAFDHDHDDVDVRLCASASYRLADDAEEMSRLTQSRDRRISWAAQSLHMESSDLYHLARRMGGYDHDHDNDALQYEFQQVQRAYLDLERAVRGPAREDHTVPTLWQSVQRDYSYLERIMWGQLERQAD